MTSLLIFFLLLILIIFVSFGFLPTNFMYILWTHGIMQSSIVGCAFAFFYRIIRIVNSVGSVEHQLWWRWRRWRRQRRKRREREKTDQNNNNNINKQPSRTHRHRKRDTSIGKFANRTEKIFSCCLCVLLLNECTWTRGRCCVLTRLWCARFTSTTFLYSARNRSKKYMYKLTWSAAAVVVVVAPWTESSKVAAAAATAAVLGAPSIRKKVDWTNHFYRV